MRKTAARWAQKQAVRITSLLADPSVPNRAWLTDLVGKVGAPGVWRLPEAQPYPVSLCVVEKAMMAPVHWLVLVGLPWARDYLEADTDVADNDIYEAEVEAAAGHHDIRRAGLSRAAGVRRLRRDQCCCERAAPTPTPSTGRRCRAARCGAPQ